MKHHEHHVSWKITAVACATVVLVGSAGYLALQGGGAGLPAPKVEASTAPTLVGTSSSGKFGAQSGGVGKPQASSNPSNAGSLDSLPRLLSVQSAPIGVPLRATAGVNSDSDKGRVVKLEAAAARQWSAVKMGERIALPTASGDLVEGFVNLVIPDNGWVRIAGELTDQTGTFQLASCIDEVAGVILRPTLGVGYQIAQDGDELILLERHLASLVCSGKESAAAPEFGSTAIDAGSLTTGTVTTVAPVVRTDVPLLNTRPGSKGVIFVDFAGASITDPSWNGGKTIVAAPSKETPASITSIVKAVAEDYAPFNITITTDRDLYAATPAGLRMRAVVTPTNTAAPGTGGVAFIGAWASAGKGFKSDTVCWVFNGGTKVCAETISHEVGHTLGLGHDGLAATKTAAGVAVAGQTYFYGHGGGMNVPTSWGPIMGAPFSVSLSQWSKGEYAGANNTQDDVAVIASDANGFGYISNGSPNAILPASTQSGSFMVNGLLQRATVPDTFAFQTKGGTFTASARPANVSSNVDVQLTLTDGGGATVATSSLPDALSAALNVTLTQGSYVLAVRSAGTGPKPTAGYSTGYSEYGSLGGYILSGSVSGLTDEPIFGSTRDFVGVMGKPLNFPIGVTASSTLSLKDGSLPDGLTLDVAKKVITGTPTDDTDGPVSFVLNATNDFGSVDATFNVTVSDVSAPVVNALGGSGRVYNVINSTSSPWTGEMRIGADGVVRAVAESGSIVNGGSSALRFTSFYNGDPKRASAYYLFSFWWKASTEADQDTVKLRVGGALVNDFVTGRPVQLSGATDWVKQTVRVATGTFPAFEFTYSKDGSLSAGRDRVWMYVDSFGLPPVIVNQPPAVVVSNTSTLSTTASAFVLQAKVDGADSVAWFKDGVTLKDGTSSSGSQISGATTGVLTVLKASGADTGSYWMEAKNSYGTVSCSRSKVIIGSVPVITQQPVAPDGLKVGDTLVLTAAAGGTGPMTYQWDKDGAIQSSTSSPTFQKDKITTASAGSYSVTVYNGFGSKKSNTVKVNVTAPPVITVPVVKTGTVITTGTLTNTGTLTTTGTLKTGTVTTTGTLSVGTLTTTGSLKTGTVTTTTK